LTGERLETADQPLFDSDLVPALNDHRSVGELLRDVDAQTRLLLFDATGDTAGPMLRGWPDVVAAATSVWQALPGRPVDPDRAAALDRPVVRIAGVTDALSESLRVTTWPGAGPVDPRTVAVTDTLARAGQLVARYGAEVHAEHAAVHRDIQAARTRVVHALYVTAHAVRVALHEYSRDVRRAAEASGHPIPSPKYASPHVVGRTATWLERLSSCERVAGQYLKGRYPQSLAGEVDPPPDDPARLRRALAAWDVQVHRTLAARPTPANIVVATGTQATVAAATARLLDAAERAGGILPSHAAGQLLPAVESAGYAWTQQANRWGDLWSPSDAPDPALTRAAAEVRAAYAEYTHEKTGPASLTDVAARPGVAAAVQASLEALQAAPELAHALTERTADPTLRGPARTLSIRAHNEVEAGLVAGVTSDEDIVWVRPADIAAKRLVPLPAPPAESLKRAATRTAQLTTAAAHIVDNVDPTTHSLLRGAPRTLAIPQGFDVMSAQCEENRSVSASDERATLSCRSP